MSTRKTSPRRKAGQRNAQRGASHVGSGDVVVCGPRTSEARIMQLTNDISEGYKTGTKEELRDCVTWWSLRHAEAYGREKSLAHDLVIFALKKSQEAQRGATDNNKLTDAPNKGPSPER